MASPDDFTFRIELSQQGPQPKPEDLPDPKRTPVETPRPAFGFTTTAYAGANIPMEPGATPTPARPPQPTRSLETSESEGNRLESELKTLSATVDKLGNRLNSLRSRTDTPGASEQGTPKPTGELHNPPQPKDTLPVYGPPEPPKRQLGLFPEPTQTPTPPPRKQSAGDLLNKATAEGRYTNEALDEFERIYSTLTDRSQRVAFSNWTKAPVDQEGFQEWLAQMRARNAPQAPTTTPTPQSTGTPNPQFPYSFPAGPGQRQLALPFNGPPPRNTQRTMFGPEPVYDAQIVGNPFGARRRRRRSHAFQNLQNARIGPFRPSRTAAGIRKTFGARAGRMAVTGANALVRGATARLATAAVVGFGSMSTGAGIGAAVGGPAGMVIGLAAGAAADALMSLKRAADAVDRRFLEMADELRVISPSVARASAQSEINRLRALQYRDQRMGPGLGRLLETESEIDQIKSMIETELKSPFLPLFQDIKNLQKDLLEALLQIAKVFNTVVGEVRLDDIIRNLTPLVAGSSTMGTILGNILAIIADLWQTWKGNQNNQQVLNNLQQFRLFLNPANAPASPNPAPLNNPFGIGAPI
jgi:hypothetical protein